MKKLIQGAPAALAGMLLASTAYAQGETEQMMSLGGYTNYAVGFGDYLNGGTEKSDATIGVLNETEIFFSGSGETDDGLVVSARVELEGHNQSGSQVDEHYITVSGDFGSVEIGANDAADERTAVGISYNNTPVSTVYWTSLPVPGVTGYRGPGSFDDAMGITYTSPDFGGGKFVVGYKPSAGGDSGQQYSGGDDEALITAGVKFSTDVSGYGFTGSVGYSTVDLEEGGKKTVLGLGGTLGFGDFTVYGRYQKDETDHKVRSHLSQSRAEVRSS